MENLIEELRKSILATNNVPVDFKKEKNLDLFIAGLKTMALSKGSASLTEPLRSLALLSVVGRRPVSCLTILEIMVESNGNPLLGKQISARLSEKLGLERKLVAGSDYSDNAGEILSNLCEIGVLRKEHLPRSKPGYVLTSLEEVSAILSCFKDKKRSLLMAFGKPIQEMDLIEVFKSRFDNKVGKIKKSNGDENFVVSQLMKSIYKQTDIDFYVALSVLMEIEPKLKHWMTSGELHTLVYETLLHHDRKAAENFLEQYHQPIYVECDEGKRELTIQYVKDVIRDETRGMSLQNKFTNTLIDDALLYCKKSRSNLKERELHDLIRAHIHSKCFVPDHVESTVSKTLEESKKYLELAEKMIDAKILNTAFTNLKRVGELLRNCFLISMGYAPFLDATENAEFAKSILEDRERKPAIYQRFGLDADHMIKFRSIAEIMSSTNKDDLRESNRLYIGLKMSQDRLESWRERAKTDSPLTFSSRQP